MATSNEKKIFNDCVHGHIALPRVCVSIIDTQIFQRLRNIKQLGFGYFVYPGASHNRFEHSLGVCHLAGEMIDTLNKNSHASKPGDSPPIGLKEKLCIQIAALCHDIGHGPFSHVWERFMHQPGRDPSWEHEEMSIKLFDELCKEEKVRREMKRCGIKDEDYTFIKSLISGKPQMDGNNTNAYLYEIVCNKANGIDVDKWDYLLRDSKQLNINITFDPQRLLSFSRIAECNGQKHICFRDKVCDVIYQMFLMRAELHRKAYQHPVVKLIEDMWLDALETANKHGYEFDGLKLDEIHKVTEKYVNLTDHIFQDIFTWSLKASNRKETKKILARIQERNFYHRVEKEVLHQDEDMGNIQKKIIEFNSQNHDVPNKHLFAFEVQFEIKGENLSQNVYLYSKENINEARPISDWPNVVPIFSMKNLKRNEVLFYTKSEIKEEQEEAKEAANDIMKNIRFHN